ncbi:MAG: nucleotidyl transferase AbiEii/AbiGii toxin family protein [Candidatus Nanohaloarchaea archaeon]
MITERKLKQIADQNKINPYYQEKDYLQNILLREISGEDMVFKGGTCLKICYNLPRFSEDLDFNTEKAPEEIEEIIRNGVKAFGRMGIDTEFERSEKFEQNSSYTAHIRFEGPLYRGNRSSTNTVQVDAGKRTGTILETDVKQVTSPYPDIPSYFLTTIQLEEILAEKIAAMDERSKGRDLFDIWFLIDKTGINEDLIDQKTSGSISVSFPSEEDYRRDLSDLLPNVPPYEKVSKSVKQNLEKEGLKVNLKL